MLMTPELSRSSKTRDHLVYDQQHIVFCAYLLDLRPVLRGWDNTAPATLDGLTDESRYRILSLLLDFFFQRLGTVDVAVRDRSCRSGKGNSMATVWS